MVAKYNIEMDEPFLKKFFGLTKREFPKGEEITISMLKTQLDEIENTLLNPTEEHKTIQSPSSQAEEKNSTSDDNSFNDFSSKDKFNLDKKNILIIDDLGVITYQLEVLFKDFGFNAVTSKEIYDAIEKFKKQTFDMVIMDLFIPTEREGLILLEELKKTALTKSKPVKIGVMSASSRKDHKQLCKQKGAEFYVEKVDDWQKELFKLVKDLK